MSHSRRLSSFVVLLIILQSVAVLAQPPGRGRRGRPSINRAVALGFGQVREELGIGEDQAATIQAAIDAYQEERRESRPDRSELQFLSDEEQQELREEMRKAAEEASRQADETLAALLEPEQLQRLDQLILQAQLKLTPVEALRSRVELTEEQQTKLREVESQAQERQMELRSRMMERFQGRGRGETNWDEIRKMVADLQEQNRSAAMGVLTEDQAASIKELQGEEFEIDLQALMRGAGRRGRGGPGGGRGRGGRGDDDGRRRGRPQRPASDDDT